MQLKVCPRQLQMVVMSEFCWIQTTLIRDSGTLADGFGTCQSIIIHSEHSVARSVHNDEEETDAVFIRMRMIATWEA
jgi:hypothetical protein